MEAAEFGRACRTPLIELTELTKDRVCFILRNVDVSIANALRRVMIAEVPTLAVELVTMIENTSVLHDEFIAHRLGLLPIDSIKIRDYKYKEECSCADRCRNCSVEFRLDVMCRDSDGLTVTHLDLTSTDPVPGSPMPVPRAEDMTSSFGSGITIAKLKKNQRLKCDLVATKGIGKLHAKWIPTATAVFQYELDISINEKVLETVPPETQQEIAKACPHGTFTCEGDAFTPPTLAVTHGASNVYCCDECVVAAKEKGYPDLIRISHKPDVFRFTVESTGALPPEQIVELAFEVLDGKLKDLLTETSKLEGFTSEEVIASSKTVSNKLQREGRHHDSRWDDDFILDLS